MSIHGGTPAHRKCAACVFYVQGVRGEGAMFAGSRRLLLVTAGKYTYDHWVIVALLQNISTLEIRADS